MWIEQAKVHAAMAKVAQGDGYAQGKEWAPKVSGLIDALLDALPVVEAALAANPATSIAIALGDTLTPWQEKEEDETGD